MVRHHGLSCFWSSTPTIAANQGATLAIVVRIVQQFYGTRQDWQLVIDSLGANLL